MDDVGTTGLSRSIKISERVAAAIVRDIVARKLPTGTKLPTEAAMLELYGVSRGSLREALRILEVNGLISMKPGPHGGPVVGQVSSTHFSRTLSLFLEMGYSTFGDVLDARVAIEPLFARLAASAIDKRGRTEIEAMLVAHESLDHKDVSAYLAVVQEFHASIARLSGNGVISLFGEALTQVFSNRALETHQPAARRTQVKTEHLYIARAILEGDAVGAEENMREHMTAFACSFRRRHNFLIDDVVGWY